MTSHKGNTATPGGPSAEGTLSFGRNLPASMESLVYYGSVTTNPLGEPMTYRQNPASLALPPSQQAAVVSLAKKVGLDPTEFRWAAQPSRYHLGRLVSVLEHTPTGASFRFEFIESAMGQNRVSVFAPEDHSPEARKAAASWEDQLDHVREWLTRLVHAKK